MRHWLKAGLMLLVAPQAFAQQAVPNIAFDSVPNPLKLPPNMYFGEVTGVAVNSKGHIFALSRGNTTGPAYAAAATQLLEFDKDGKFLREIGKNLYAWSFGHTVKIDPQDNIWVADKGSDMVVKFNPAGRVVMVFGRKQEASDEDTGPVKHPKPPLPSEEGRFRQVTDVHLGQGRQHLHQRRLYQFARRQGRQGRQLAEVVGRPRQGARPVQHPASRSLPTPTATSTSPTAPTTACRSSTATANSCASSRSTFRCRRAPSPRSARSRTKPAMAGGTFSIRASPWSLCNHAAAEPGAVQLGCVAGPHLQAQPRRASCSACFGQSGKQLNTVRLDPRDGVSVGERAVRGGSC